MLAKTDDEHALTLSQIMDELEKYWTRLQAKSVNTESRVRSVSEVTT